MKKTLITIAAGCRNNPAVNAATAWRTALRQAVAENAAGVHFPAGEYHFYAPGTTRIFASYSNNDDGLKQIVFYLEKLQDFTVSGDGAKLVFHGRLSPFLVRECRNITLCGLEIDFAESYAEDAVLLDRNGDTAWMQIGGNWRVSGGKMHFFHDILDNYSGGLRFTAFDRATGDYPPSGFGKSCRNQVLKREKDKVLLPLAMPDDAPEFYLMRHQGRLNPAVVIDRSVDTVVADVTLRRAGGMGFLAQNSENILVENLTVAPAEGRSMGVTDDAVHFSECAGLVEIKNCLLRNTLDDAINIHGVYRKLRYRVGEYLLEGGHFQQFGIWDGRAGDEMELAKAATMQSYGVVHLKSIAPANKQHCFVKFAEPLPAEYVDGDIIRNLRAGKLQVKITGTTISNTRSRGVLVSGTEYAEVSNCDIHAPGAGIFIAGDMNYWYESGPNRNVVIKDNIFRRCHYMKSSVSRAPVTVAPEIPHPVPGTFYHGKISLLNNRFILANGDPALFLRQVTECTMQGNTYEAAPGTELKIADIKECGSVSPAD